MMNIINGGAHANNGIDMQEFMVMPLGFDTFSDGLRAGVEIFHNLKKILADKGYSTAVGDEGGFAPDIKTNEEAIQVIMQAIEKAGYTPGEQVKIALDCAATEFFKDGKYTIEGKPRSARAMVDLLAGWADEVPDLQHRGRLLGRRLGRLEEPDRRVGDDVQLVGDDLFVTNVKRLERRHR